MEHNVKKKPRYFDSCPQLSKCVICNIFSVLKNEVLYFFLCRSVTGQYIALVSKNSYLINSCLPCLRLSGTKGCTFISTTRRRQMYWCLLSCLFEQEWRYWWQNKKSCSWCSWQVSAVYESWCEFLSFCLFVCLSVCLFLCLFACLFVCLFV